MDKNLDQIVSQLNLDKNKEKLNQLVSDYQPFVISIISNIKNQYIRAENDEAFSIGLMAFVEAIERYDKSKGNFLTFAKLVISSRVKTYLQKESKNVHYSLDELENSSMEVELTQEENDLRDEILLFEKELHKFGLDFEVLVDSCPKHQDTRDKAVEIATQASGEKDLVAFLYEKMRLPIAKIAERFFVSVKIIKKSKLFITAVMVVIVNNFTEILSWIKNSKKGPQI